MKILFIHQNFPGQFKFLAPALQKAGHQVAVLVPKQNLKNVQVNKKIALHSYPLLRGNTKGIHDWLLDLESKVIRGQSCAKYALSMKEAGYIPDIIIAHPGWGESLFLKEVWSDAILKIYCEFYYLAEGADTGFDPEFPVTDPLNACRLQMKNLSMLSHFEVADQLLAPTHWQASTFPERIRKKITVIHDGINTSKVRRDPGRSFTVPSNIQLRSDNKVLTYVSRTLEPTRGFHTFMRAVPRLLAIDSELQILIVGNEGKGYGSRPKNGDSWKNILEAENISNLPKEFKSRVHFLGRLQYEDFLSVLSISTVHIYLTYPFVLSWSFMEAMSMGCAIVASDTRPVNEVVTHDKEGLLVDFFSPEAVVGAVETLLLDEKLRARLGASARKKVVEHYDLFEKSLPRLMEWACSTP